jgi:hypothetical protein
MTPEELRDVLDAAGRQPVPPPDASFVRDLEDRLLSTRVVERPRGRAPWRTISAVAAAAAVLVAVGVLQRVDPEESVVTNPSTTSSTSTSTSSTTTSSTTIVAPTTTVFAPTTVVTVATTVAPPPPTTTTAAPTTTTTVATTTTAPPGVDDMRLSCTTDPRPKVICTWSKNEHPDFKGYRFSKRVGDGPQEEIGSTTDRAVTTKHDENPEVGARITYIIEAFDHDQNVIARSEVTVSCC